MTAPRQLLPGASYLVTRRVHERRFLLKPTKVTTQVLGYLLARAARLTGVRVHAYCVMSNHLHLVVTDPKATLPRFAQEFDSLVARAINALYGRWGHFWEGDSYHATLLDSAEEVLDRCAYVLANPVAAGLVRRARQWPGLWSAPEQVGTTVEFERPAHFFKKTSRQAEKLGLNLEVPRGFGSAEAFRERLVEALKAREEKAGRERLGFLGVARVLKQRALDRPETRERRREQRPRFAARNVGRLEALRAELKAFLAAYREALHAWREGWRRVVFPAGTYQLRVEHQVVCAGAG